MTKLNLVLLAALLASCLVLVRSAYEARRVFAALDAARSEQRQLDAEFKRLDAEAQAQSTHLRVERTARERLQMRTATPGVMAYVADPAVGATASLPLPHAEPKASPSGAGEGRGRRGESEPPAASPPSGPGLQAAARIASEGAGQSQAMQPAPALTPALSQREREQHQDASR